MKALLITIAALVIAGGSFLLFEKLFAPASGTTSTTTGPSVTYTSSGTSGNTTTDVVTAPATTANTFSVRSIGGGTIKTKDFTKLSTTVVDKANPGHYFLAGVFSSSNPNPPYTITYTTSDQSFTVALWQKPLGQTRVAAQKFLQTTLGISEVQMCNLAYYISVSNDVDASYGNKNLGFSFCPGATAFPN